MAGEPESENGQAGDGQREAAFTEDRLVLSRLLAERIKELHITRREIERRSNVSTATIREIEHPRRPRTFGRDVLGPVSEALGWAPDYLERAAYGSSSAVIDPIVEGIMTALAPYLGKLDAISGIQEDVAAIKAELGIRADVVYPAE